MAAMIESTTGLFASACGTTACDKNVAGYAIPNHVHGLQHLSSGSRRPSRSPQIERNNPRMAVVMDRSVSDCRISDRSVGDCQAVLPKAIPQARWLLKRPAGDRFDRPSTLNKLQLSFTRIQRRDLANVRINFPRPNHKPTVGRFRPPPSAVRCWATSYRGSSGDSQSNDANRLEYLTCRVPEAPNFFSALTHADPCATLA